MARFCEAAALGGINNPKAMNDMTSKIRTTGFLGGTDFIAHALEINRISFCSNFTFKIYNHLQRPFSWREKWIKRSSKASL
jgi:hypothetical protein